MLLYVSLSFHDSLPAVQPSSIQFFASFAQPDRRFTGFREQYLGSWGEGVISLRACCYTRARTLKNAQRHRNHIKTVNIGVGKWLWLSRSKLCEIVASFARKMSFSKSALISDALLIWCRKLVYNVSHAILQID